MIPQKRLESLQTKKAMLAERIMEEERSPSANAMTLRQLKKQKLELSEILQGLRHDSATIH